LTRDGKSSSKLIKKGQNITGLSSTFFLCCSVVVLLITSGLSNLSAQDSLEHKKDKNLIVLADSMFFDRDTSRWSIRALANFKDNNFKLSNDDYTLSYYPNNRSGVGVGFASSKLVLDLIINIKSNKEEVTDRFDMQGNMFLKNNFIVFQVQHYQGFNVRNTSTDDPGIFRRDIRTFLTSLNLLHIFKSDMKTLSMIYTGMHANFKSTGSFLAGINLAYYTVRSDSSIVPESSQDLFNEKANITDFRKYAVGITAGYGHLFKLPGNFLLLVAFTPGFGLNFRDITTETISYSPSELMEVYVYGMVVLAYNRPAFYVELGDENTWNFASLGSGNKGTMNSTKLKLAFGWKLGRKR
jgi:hypothetical protein